MLAGLRFGSRPARLNHVIFNLSFQQAVAVAFHADDFSFSGCKTSYPLRINFPQVQSENIMKPLNQFPLGNQTLFQVITTLSSAIHPATMARWWTLVKVGCGVIPGCYLEDHPRTRTLLTTLVIVSPLGLWDPFQNDLFMAHMGGDPNHLRSSWASWDDHPSHPSNPGDWWGNIPKDSGDLKSMISSLNETKWDACHEGDWMESPLHICFLSFRGKTRFWKWAVTKKLARVFLLKHFETRCSTNLRPIFMGHSETRC